MWKYVRYQNTDSVHQRKETIWAQKPSQQPGGEDLSAGMLAGCVERIKDLEFLAYGQLENLGVALFTGKSLQSLVIVRSFLRWRWE